MICKHGYYRGGRGDKIQLIGHSHHVALQGQLSLLWLCWKLVRFILLPIPAPTTSAARILLTTSHATKFTASRVAETDFAIAFEKLLLDKAINRHACVTQDINTHCSDDVRSKS